MKIYLAGNAIGDDKAIKSAYKLFKHRLLSYHYYFSWAKKQIDYLHKLKNNV